MHSTRKQMDKAERSRLSDVMSNLKKRGKASELFKTCVMLDFNSFIDHIRRFY